MFSQPFYHQLTKKTIVAFGQLFSNIKIQRFNNEGNREQLIDVPVSYGNREKWYQRLQEEASVEQRVLISMPRIGFEIVGIKYDPSRRLNRLTQFRACNPTLAGNFLSAYSPVPYILTFNVYILTKTQDDMFQIIEQIIPYFGPQYNLTINAIPNLEIVQDIPITLDGIAMNDSYEGPMENRREVISTLTFSAKNEYLGAIKDDSDTIILKTQVDIKTPSNAGTRVTTFVNGPFNDYEILENYFPIISNQVDTTFRFYGSSYSIGSASGETESLYSPIGDPFFSDVVVLLHFEGSDQSTIFENSGPLGGIINGPEGPPYESYITTQNSKFGTASFSPFQYSNLYHSISGINVSNEKFTIESWMYRLSNYIYNDRFALFKLENWNDASASFSFYGDAGGIVLRNLYDVPLISLSSSSIPFDEWFHIAITYDLQKYRIFLNGNIIAETSQSVTSGIADTIQIAMNSGEGIRHDGFIDEFRFTKNVARYTSNFIVPTEAFKDF